MPTLTITDTKLYVPLVTSTTQDNAKLLKQLQVGYKKATRMNMNLKLQNRHKANIQCFLIDLSFQGVYKLFVYYLNMIMVETVKRYIIF